MNRFYYGGSHRLRLILSKSYIPIFLEIYRWGDNWAEVLYDKIFGFEVERYVL